MIFIIYGQSRAISKYYSGVSVVIWFCPTPSTWHIHILIHSVDNKSLKKKRLVIYYANSRAKEILPLEVSYEHGIQSLYKIH